MYGTLDLNDIEKTIIQVIRKHRRIRWLQLMNIIVKEGICSERIFRETLNRLVKKGLVFRDEIKKQFTEYYVEKDFELIEKQSALNFENDFKVIQKINQLITHNRSKIPIEDLAGYITTLWKIINQMEYKGEILSLILNSSRISKRKDCDQLKLNLLKLMLNSKNVDKILDLFYLTDQYLQYETNEIVKMLKEDLISKNIKLSLT